MPDKGHIELERRIDSITVGVRHRKDPGDLNALMRSIEEVGLLQPVTITPDGVLICGWRRLEALFEEIADLPEAERESALDRACRTPDGDPDDALRAEVQALLDADARAETFFHLPPPPRPPGELGELPGRETLMALAGELRELVDDH